ncbi:leucine-rich repeat protein [Leyella stercorea]|uniref:leucine-rich repeat protein n=1 Tax=Leyella stercorea TaxID=363265 RepID=UPI003AEF8FC5
MQYPLISEYIEAIRYAEDNFDKLSNLRPVLDDNGNPVMSSGNFAVVFKMKDIETDKLYAVKCFIREQEERQERYREIIKVLDEIKSPYFVSTHYYDKELFVDTTQDDETEFPVLVMDWVDGISLDDYMKAIESKQFLRELLANQFQKLVCWLLPKHYAHGDLKPNNILVRDDGSIVLVDYDGMFVPSLRGKDALEMGTPMYRHIGRTLSFYNEYIDDFAAVKILLLLKVNALSAISYNQYAAGNNVEFMRLFEHLLNHSTIAPLLAAYIMVSTFGRIDRQQVSCLLSDNSDFNYNKESSLQDLARKGDTIAMQELASLYANGIYVPQNTSKAMQWNMLAKLLGNVNVTCGICKCISDNNDFIINNEAILSQLKKNRINFEYCKEGEKLYSDKKYEQAIYWWQKAADAGNSAAQKNLAICYFNGYGVEKDVEKAIYWWQKAADAGNSAAQKNLAFCYLKGDGVEKNVEKAVYWWQKAADAGDSDAEYMLELCCKMFNIKDSVNINPHEIGNIGECNTASYSDDGKRCLRYWGTWGDEYKIKDGTEVLCDDCFNDLYSECDGHYLKTLCLPSSLKRIGNNVFCASISEIICDASNFYTNDGFLLSSDNETLYRYFGHKKVVYIPKGVKYIKGGAFSEKDVEKVIIPDTVIHIGDNPFVGCHSIREIISNSNRFQVINRTLYDESEKCLIGCWNYATSYLCIKSGTKKLGKHALFGLNFQYIEIPESIEFIDEDAFFHCFDLVHIAIPSIQYNRIYNLIPLSIRGLVLEDNGLPF